MTTSHFDDQFFNDQFYERVAHYIDQIHSLAQEQEALQNLLSIKQQQSVSAAKFQQSTKDLGNLADLSSIISSYQQLINELEQRQKHLKSNFYYYITEEPKSDDAAEQQQQPNELPEFP